MRRAVQLAALVALAAAIAAGCCNTTETTVIVGRGPEGEACETTCGRAIEVAEPDRSLVSCSFGLTEDARPAVLCTFAYTVCAEHM